jgi:hypothetical protein
MLKGTPLSQINPATMKGPGDFPEPDYDDEPDCPECDEGHLEPQDLGVGCTACDYYDEPDFEAMAEARYAHRECPW